MLATVGSMADLCSIMKVSRAALRSATQGRATSSMEFAYYQPLPEALAKEIVEKRRG